MRTSRCLWLLLELDMRMCWRRAFAAPWLWLLEKLAALRGRYILACVRLDHLGNDRVVLLVLYGGRECLDEGARSIYQLLGFCQWPIEYDGNDYFSSILLDEGGSPGLHLLKDCHRFVLTYGSVPTLQWLAALVIQFAAGIARSAGFLVQPGMRWQAVWQLAWLRRLLPLGGCQCLAPRKRFVFFVQWHVPIPPIAVSGRAWSWLHIFLIPHCIVRPLACFMVDLHQVSFKVIFTQHVIKLLHGSVPMGTVLSDSSVDM